MKAEHCVIRNEKLFCMNCGTEQVISYPIDMRIYEAMGKAFVNIHKDCPKTWTEPQPQPGLSESEQANFWNRHGEHGASSDTIFSVISGNNICRGRYSHPYDPDDFRRCYLLIKTVPSWRPKLDMLKSIGDPVWEKLVENWDKLTEMLEEQMLTRKRNGMYEFMKSLGC